MIGDAEIEMLHFVRDVQEVFEIFNYSDAKVSIENCMIKVGLSNGRTAHVDEPSAIDPTTAVKVARQLRRQLQS